MRDEIIADLHATKDKLAAQFNYDIVKLIEDVRRTEVENSRQGRPLIHTSPEPKPASPFQKARFARPL
jgi:hypothetical protein